MRIRAFPLLKILRRRPKGTIFGFDRGNFARFPPCTGRRRARAYHVAYGSRNSPQEQVSALRGVNDAATFGNEEEEMRGMSDPDCARALSIHDER